MDELNKPLAKASNRGIPRFGKRLAKYSLYGVLFSGIAIGSWVVLTENPLGGEPIVTAKMEDSADSLDSRDVAVLDIREGNDLEREEISPITENSIEKPPATLTEISPTDDPGPTNNDIIIRQVEEGGSLIEPRLSHLPNRDLIESTAYGDLPKRGSDGTTPSKAYARPLGASGGFGTSRVAIVVGGLGLSQTGTQNAIEDLPGVVTLAFAPYGNSLTRWVERARRQGHEIMVQAPLEPFDYPVNDPGPHTLRVDLGPDENRKRLHWVLGRITNYVGVMNFMGARFSSNSNAMNGFLGELNKRGLMYLDDGSALRSEAGSVAGALRMPFLKSGILLDANPDADQITAQLLKLEQAAREQGVAVATASAFPASVKRIAEWVREAEKKGIDVVPISALASVDSPTQLGQN